jgi:hypothetical protein
MIFASFFYFFFSFSLSVSLSLILSSCSETPDPLGSAEGPLSRHSSVAPAEVSADQILLRNTSGNNINNNNNSSSNNPATPRSNNNPATPRSSKGGSSSMLPIKSGSNNSLLSTANGGQAAPVVTASDALATSGALTVNQNSSSNETSSTVNKPSPRNQQLRISELAVQGAEVRPLFCLVPLCCRWPVGLHSCFPSVLSLARGPSHLLSFFIDSDSLCLVRLGCPLRRPTSTCFHSLHCCCLVFMGPSFLPPR